MVIDELKVSHKGLVVSMSESTETYQAIPFSSIVLAQLDITEHESVGETEGILRLKLIDGSTTVYETLSEDTIVKFNDVINYVSFIA